MPSKFAVEFHSKDKGLLEAEEVFCDFFHQAVRAAQIKVLGKRGEDFAFKLESETDNLKVTRRK